MTMVTFGISASSFAANMAVLQNANNHSSKYLLAVQAVKKSLYVDECLTGEDTVPAAIELQSQLSNLFTEGGFFLQKWNASESTVLDNLPSDLKDLGATQKFQETTHDQYTKTLGIEWNSQPDQFRLTISKLPYLDSISDNLCPTLPRHSMSWDGSLLHLPKQRFCFNMCGNKELFGMTQFPCPFTMIGYNGAWNFIYSQRSPSLVVILTNPLKLPHLNSMDSLMPQNMPMLP